MKPRTYASTGSLLKTTLRAAALVPLAIALGSFAARADTIVTVPATADIYLAGQPGGTTVTSIVDSAIDTAPTNSPVAVALDFTGSVFTFSIVAYDPVSIDGSCFDATADAGACYSDVGTSSDSPAAGVNGISRALVAGGALVGVFVGPGGPSGTAPAVLDFATNGFPPGGYDFTTLSPLLDQQFFIGDGLTGTGTGSVQTFYAPAGATTLYLAVADSAGDSQNNLGSITVDASESETPEPGTLLAVGLGLLALSTLRRKASR